MSKMISFRVSDELYSACKAQAFKAGETFSEWLTGKISVDTTPSVIQKKPNVIQKSVIQPSIVIHPVIQEDEFFEEPRIIRDPEADHVVTRDAHGRSVLVKAEA